VNAYATEFSLAVAYAETTQQNYGDRTMEGISDIRISGIDQARPPLIRKEPYINLFFRLNHKAPAKWCEDFNDLFSRGNYPVKIEPAEGLIIETWVRKPEEIEPLLKTLKAAVKVASNTYVVRVEAEAIAAAAKGSNPDDEGEQGRLNRIIAGLDFND
jgi:hypothetical protein